MQVSVHLVRPPPADQAEAVAVDAGTEKGHSATGTCQADGDVGDRVRRVRVKNIRRADALREVGRQDVPERRRRK